MLNEKVIKQEILERFQNAANDMLDKYRLEMERSFSKYLPEAGKELRQAIETVCRKYQKAEEAGETGPLEWIWLSFLRSSLLDGAPCYRIDLYDARERLSEREYAEMWDYTHVFKSYYEIERKIMDMAERQNRLQPCEINNILSSISESFREVADQQIIQILRSIHFDFAHMATKGHSLKIMLGDYMDEALLIDEICYGEGEVEHAER